MSESAELAAKLTAEGEKLAAFFEGLSEPQWKVEVYADGSVWSIRSILAHLMTAERAFLKLFEDKYKRKTDFYGGAGWDLANIAIDAMRKVGTDRTKIRDAIQQVKNYPGTMAVLTFAPDNHRGAGVDAQLMGQFKDDKFVLIK